MNKREKIIGVFDSGLGGLTVIDALTDAMPSENFVYLGDTANMPYGTKTKGELKSCVSANTDFLTKFDIKALIIACNTVDSVLGQTLKSELSVPVFGVISPAAQQAVSLSKNKKIGVIATNVAVESGAYEREIKKHMPDADVISIACPKLVPLIESGHFSRGDEAIVRALGEYLRPMKIRGVDTLILGCTHYPLLSQTISDMLPSVALVSSSSALASVVKTALTSENSNNISKNTGKRKFYVTRDPNGFFSNAKMILGEKLKKIELASDEKEFRL